jgi:hypothetical protein
LSNAIIVPEGSNDGVPPLALRTRLLVPSEFITEMLLLLWYVMRVPSGENFGFTPEMPRLAFVDVARL